MMVMFHCRHLATLYVAAESCGHETVLLTTAGLEPCMHMNVRLSRLGELR